MNAEHDVNAGNTITAPQLRTTNIRRHTRLKIEAPIVLEKGGINVSNLGGDTVHSLGTAGLKLDFKMGDLACRNLYASGKCVLGTFEQESRNHEDGKHLNVKSLTVDSQSMYLGLMRRSYNVATHKPVTHILKRQIPTYLAAQSFSLNDIPAPFTVDNMTINNWVTLAQDFMNDTTIEVDTVFPTANTTDWEDYIDPISIDLDAAEVEIDALDTRITALEAAGGGGGELSTVTIVETANDQIIYLVDDIVGLVLVKHANLTGVECVLPSTLVDGDIILVKNYNTTDGGDNHRDPGTVVRRPSN